MGTLQVVLKVCELAMALKMQECHYAIHPVVLTQYAVASAPDEQTQTLSVAQSSQNCAGLSRNGGNVSHIMDEVTQRINNIQIRDQSKPGKVTKNSAEAVIDKASALEGMGNITAALKLIQEAIDQGIQPQHQLRQYVLDQLPACNVRAVL